MNNSLIKEVKKQFITLLNKRSYNTSKVTFSNITTNLIIVRYYNFFLLYINLSTFSIDDIFKNSTKWKLYKTSTLNKINYNKTRFFTLVYVYGNRHILKKCLDSLNNQIIKTNIILLASNRSDEQFAINNNIEFCKNTNHNIFSRLNGAINYIHKTYNYQLNYLMLCTGNTILHDNWIQCCEPIIKTSNVLRKNIYHIIDPDNNIHSVSFDVSNLFNKSDEEKLLLINGTILSKKLLNEFNWDMFSLTTIGKNFYYYIKKFGLRSINSAYISIYNNKAMNRLNNVSCIKQCNSTNLYDTRLISYYDLINKSTLSSDQNDILLVSNNVQFNSKLTESLPNYKFIHITDFNSYYIKHNKFCIGIVLDDTKDIDSIIRYCGLFGIPIIANKNYPHCINYYDEDEYIIYLANFVLNNYDNYRHIISSSFTKYTNNAIPTNNVVVIASHKRQSILRSNINLLKTHSNINNIIVSVTDDSDVKLCKELNVNYCVTRNQPLGEKWQHGIIFSKIFYPKNIIIIGSDDFIFPGFISNALCKYNSHDLYIPRKWIIWDINTDDYYMTKYTNETNGIGCGRIINCSVMNKINWLLYPIIYSSSLDYHSNKRIQSVSDNIVIDNYNSTILCPKYDVECMNPITNFINNDGFASEKINNISSLINKYQLDTIKKSFIQDSSKNINVTIVESYDVPLVIDNFSITTSLAKLDIEDNIVKIIMSDERGTPGIFVNTSYIKPNKYYKLYINHNNLYNLNAFIVYKDNGEYMTYNKHCIINNICYLDTYDINKFNLIAIVTPKPSIGAIEIYGITITEILYET